MTHFFSTKTFVASAIAFGAIVAGSAAHARTDVILVQHEQARTIYTQPHTVQFGHDRDRFDRHDRRGGAFGDADRDGIPNKFDRDSRFFDARATFRHAQWGDFDRDGVVNAFDRAPRNPRRH